MPLNISVIIPARNAPTYLEECLSSIKDQKVITQDVVVDVWVGVDSCEETQNYLSKSLVNFPNTRAFYFNERLGPYIIRNTLATLCNADYIVFFDSDDIMTEEFLQNLITPFKSHDIVHFGLKDFIEVKNKNGESNKVFDQKAIKKFEKTVINQNTILIEGKQSFLNTIANIKKSKYFNLNRYYKFVDGLFKQRKSGVFAIKKNVFLNMNGFKAWPVQADIEFIARANWMKTYNITSPKEIFFLRRIHNNNLTSSYKWGMNSPARKEYQEKSKTSIYETETMVINNNYSEIFSV